MKISYNADLFDEDKVILTLCTLVDLIFIPKEKRTIQVHMILTLGGASQPFLTLVVLHDMSKCDLCY